MKLTVVGSGTCIFRKERKGPCFLLEAGRELLLFDCGWGAGVGLLEAGVDIQKIDHIFITHPHSDHLGNLIPLVQSIWVAGEYYPQMRRKKDLLIHAYKGFKKDYEKLRGIMFPERPEDYKIKIFEYQNESREFEGFVAQSRIIKHKPEFFNSVGFRIQSQGKTFVYSGDCGNDSSLRELATGADLALFEAAVPASFYRKYGPQPNHLSAFEGGSIAQQAGVKKLILTHWYDVDQESEIIKAAKKHFEGKVIIAKDLQKITV